MEADFVAWCNRLLEMTVEVNMLPVESSLICLKLTWPCLC